MFSGSSCALINRSSNTLWWEVQLRTLSSAQADRAECFSRSCSFHKNSQFPAIPEEEMLKVPSCTVRQGGNQGLQAGGAPLPGLSLASSWQARSPVWGPHTAAFRLNLCCCFNAEVFFFFLSFCSYHIVPVTRATWHRSRENTLSSCQLLGRENGFGCLKYASHVDFLIMTCFQSQTQ